MDQFRRNKIDTFPKKEQLELIDRLIDYGIRLNEKEIEMATKKQKNRYIELLMDKALEFQRHEIIATTPKQMEKYINKKRYFSISEYGSMPEKFQKMYIDSIIRRKNGMSSQEFEVTPHQLKIYYCNQSIEKERQLGPKFFAYMSRENQKKYVDMVLGNGAKLTSDYEVYMKSGVKSYYDKQVKETPHLWENKLRKQIRAVLKEQMENVLDEDYPSSFNFDEFKSLSSFAKRIKYCETHLQRISSGSARIVYKIDDEKVLKLAKNAKGLAQNEAEINAGNDYSLRDLGVVAEVYDSHPDFLWLEMELCKKITTRRFKELTGIDFSDFKDIILYEGRQMGGRQNSYFGLFSKPKIEGYWEHDFVYSILQYMSNYDVSYGDLSKLSTYGENSKGEAIIIDFGLTEEVYKSHYS